jgi:cyanophycinase-like exopeptidase
MTDKMRPVYLLAGGRLRSNHVLHELIRTVFRESGKAVPSVAYIGAANEDNEQFFEHMSGVFQTAAPCRVDHALVCARGADLSKAKRVIESADVVFISGGDVDLGMRLLVEKQMVGFLSGLYREGHLFFGLSAGSIMLGREWIDWGDSEDIARAKLFPCLGFAPVICDTHDETDGWPELLAVLQLEKNGTTGYGIATNTALRVTAEGGVEALGGAVHQYVRDMEEVKRITDILPLKQRPVRK